MTIRPACLALLFTLALSLSPDARAAMPEDAEEGLAPGTAAPPFTLPDLRGVDFAIGRHLGQSAVVLSFWSIYCDSCVDEMVSLQKLEDKFRGKGLLILAVNEDIRVSRDRIRRFLERLEKFRGRITYPILFDQEGKVFSAFRGSHLPTLVLIDRQGKVAASFRGFDQQREGDLLTAIEVVAGGSVATPPSPPPADEHQDLVSVVGEAALCGFFDESGWRKSFSGSESRDQEMELTRDLSRRDATRQAVAGSLRLLGVKLMSNEPRRDCIDGDGIHFDRDPLNTHDPLSNLIGTISYSDFLETLSEQEMLIGNRYLSSRRVLVSRDDLMQELSSMGYLFEPVRIQFTYVNMTPLDQKHFVLSLLDHSRFIGRIEDPVVTPASTSQVFEVYTSSQGFVDEILKMDFERLKVFVEQVTPTGLEVEVWK